MVRVIIIVSSAYMRTSIGMYARCCRWVDTVSSVTCAIKEIGVGQPIKSAGLVPSVSEPVAGDHGR